MKPFLSVLFRKNSGLVRIQRDTLKTAFFATCVWGMLAHGFCYFNLSYSHDSMLVYQNDFAHQISIGRFLQPVYLLFRGHIAAPALIGFLSLLFISLSVYLVVRLLCTADRLSIWLYSGILTTNATVTLLNATYIPFLDIFMLSLLLAVLAVFACRNLRFGFPLSAGLLFLSLSLYQSYFQVAVYLFMFLAVKDLLSGKSCPEVLADGSRAIGSLLISLSLYYLIWQLVLRFTGIAASSEYNGLSGVGKYDGFFSLVTELYNAYAYTIRYFAHPRIFHSQAMAWVNGILVLCGFISFCRILAREKIENNELILAFLLVLLMPLGMNVIAFISHGMEHDLMVYSFYLSYIFIYDLCIADREGIPRDHAAFHRLKNRSLSLFLAVILFNSIVYAHQAYTYKDLIYQSTRSTVNRMIARLEADESYVPGETPVAFIGTFDRSPLCPQPKGFDLEGTGLEHLSALSYYQTYDWYFQTVAAYPLELTDEDTAAALSEDPDVKEMPVFPAKGSCRILDGMMIVKLSE